MTTKHKPKTTLTHNQDQFNCSERSEEKSKVKNLTNWSVNLKEIKSNKGNSKSIIALTGN